MLCEIPPNVSKLAVGKRKTSAGRIRRIGPKANICLCDAKNNMLVALNHLHQLRGRR
jgi:hypothetical protein